MLDYFSPQQTFDQGTTNSASKTAVRKDIHDKKATQKTLSANEQKEAFAEHLKNAQEKSNAEAIENQRNNRKNAAQKARDDAKAANTNEAKGVKDDNSATLETLLQRITGNSETLELVQTTSAAPDSQNAETGDIAALTAEIQGFLTQLLEASEEDHTDLNALLATLEEDGELQNLFDILSFALDISESVEAPTKTQLDILDTITDQLKTLNKESIITSGLTPQDITDLQEKIAALISNEHAQEEQEILAELAGIITQLNEPKNAAKDTAKTTTENVKIIPSTLEAPRSEHHAQSRYDGRYDIARSPQDSTSQDTHAKADKALTQAPKAAANMAQNTGPNATPSTANIANADPLLSFDALLQNQNAAATPTTTLSPLQNSASNVITQSQSAAHAHPATQAVSMTIARAVKGGDSTDIKLQLDPPELGRVEVKMSIDKDNTTKIVLTAEKPETYMMLQKDSQVLERAMAEAGLNADDGLSFELASENHDFGGRGKQNGQSGQKSANQDDGTIINSSMDWHVDPNTGHMHYSILA